jgi:hypothetical protein
MGWPRATRSEKRSAIQKVRRLAKLQEKHLATRKGRLKGLQRGLLPHSGWQTETLTDCLTAIPTDYLTGWRLETLRAKVKCSRTGLHLDFHLVMRLDYLKATLTDLEKWKPKGWQTENPTDYLTDSYLAMQMVNLTEMRMDFRMDSYLEMPKVKGKHS